METMNESWMFNYDDVFFCYHTEEGKVFDKTIDHHMLVFVHSGELTVGTISETLHIRQGGCVFLHRNHTVSIIKQPSPDGEPFRGIFLVFRKSFLKPYYDRHPATELEKNLIEPLPDVVQFSCVASIKSLFMSMIPYFDTNTKPTPEMMRLKLQEGLLALLQTDERFFPCLFDFTAPWKIDIEDFMNKNYMYDLSLAELARFTGRSLASFKRDFRQFSTLSPGRWLTRKRLEVAYNLLTSTQMSATDVAYKVGFKNTSHFSTAFRHRYGISPSQVV